MLQAQEISKTKIDIFLISKTKLGFDSSFTVGQFPIIGSSSPLRLDRN